MAVRHNRTEEGVSVSDPRRNLPASSTITPLSRITGSRAVAILTTFGSSERNCCALKHALRVFAGHCSLQADDSVLGRFISETDQIFLRQSPEQCRRYYFKPVALLINYERNAAALVNTAIFQNFRAIHRERGQQTIVSGQLHLGQLTV